MRRPDETSRGVTPVVAVVLLVAVVTVLAAAVAVTALGVTDALGSPPPRAALAGGELAAHGERAGGVVSVAHLGGETLSVGSLALAVDATDACGKTGRLHSLPLGAGNDIDPANVAGADVFDGQSVRRFGERPHVLVRERWAPGQTLAFRIPRVDCPLAPGDRVAVRVVHEPTDAVVARLGFVA